MKRDARYRRAHTGVAGGAITQARIDDCTSRLDRATRLIGGLGGERTRWAQRSRELAEQHAYLAGDLSVAAAFCAYLGPFSQGYRADASAEWLRAVRARGLRSSKGNFSLAGMLSDPLQVSVAAFLPTTGREHTRTIAEIACK